MKRTKLLLLAILFTNIFLAVAIGLSILQVEQFVLVYCILQTITIVFNVFVGVSYACQKKIFNKDKSDVCTCTESEQTSVITINGVHVCKKCAKPILYKTYGSGKNHEAHIEK